MVLLTDETLTYDGLEAKGAGRVLLLACGALAKEILDIIKINGWTHLDLQCLPAIFHNFPDKITPAVEEALDQYQSEYDDVFVVYADCGTGGQLQALCDARGVSMVEGPHCYSFFEGNAAFAETGEMTCFYLTDFLVRQFDAFVWKPLGLDKHPELLEMYFGNYTTLVYQAQTENPALTEKAAACAQRMGLAFERRATGYGDLSGALSSQSLSSPGSRS